jgi:hypothetical protein
MTEADEWPFWSEKFLSKAKRYGLKDLLLGKLSIPRSDEEFDVTSEIGKEKSRIIKLNELGLKLWNQAFRRINSWFTF